jgi:fluoride ion exporter CrcB/FEX
MQVWATWKLKFMSEYILRYFVGEDKYWEMQLPIMTRVTGLDFLPDPNKGCVPMVHSPRHPNERNQVVEMLIHALPIATLIGYKVCLSPIKHMTGWNIFIHRVKEMGICNLDIALMTGFHGTLNTISDSITTMSLNPIHLLRNLTNDEVIVYQSILGTLPLLTIWVIEGQRRGNRGSLINL